MKTQLISRSDTIIFYVYKRLYKKFLLFQSNPFLNNYFYWVFFRNINIIRIGRVPNKI